MVNQLMHELLDTDMESKTRVPPVDEHARKIRNIRADVGSRKDVADALCRGVRFADGKLVERRRYL